MARGTSPTLPLLGRGASSTANYCGAILNILMLPDTLKRASTSFGRFRAPLPRAREAGKDRRWKNTSGTRLLPMPKRVEGYLP